VARNGSLVGAGKALGVNHATVGRQLKKAEDLLNSRLFDRLSTGLYPTAAGEAAISYAERIEMEVESANLRLLGADDSMAGSVRLSVPLNLVAYGLSGDLREFTRLHPDIYLDLNGSDETVSFLSRNVDVVVRANNNPSSGLWGFRLATIAYSFYASRSFLKTWKSLMDSDPQNVPLPYVALNDTEQWRDRDQLLRIYPSAVAVAETNGLDSMLPMVRDGIGAGRLGRYMGERFEELVPLTRCEEQCNRSLWVLTHPDFRETRRIRALMEFLRDRFAERSHQFS
jgi:DNA-binding transcriptional LysR family regulator